MSALNTQVGGDHYKRLKLQPAQLSQGNDLSFLDGCAVKRVCRHSRGGKGREDVLKVIHELQLAEELSSQGPIDPDDFAEANQLTPLEREIVCAIDAGNRRKAIDLARLLLEAEYPK